METCLGMKAKCLYLNIILRNFLCTLTSTNQSYLDHFKNPLRMHDSISSAIPEFYTSNGIQTADITQKKENILKF